MKNLSLKERLEKTNTETFHIKFFARGSTLTRCKFIAYLSFVNKCPSRAELVRYMYKWGSL